ncbi:hypothetical protein [Paenibacillus sp. MER TA 81-3]|nr:hypothetical protein [Paenibacillus sp. MER TA 81-3]
MRITPIESGINVSGRLDRLPIGSIHRKTLMALALFIFLSMQI